MGILSLSLSPFLITPSYLCLVFLGTFWLLSLCWSELSWVSQGCAGLALGQVVLSWKVFDVQRKVTYKNLNSWYKELREFRPEIPCIVVANKIDGECTFCSQLARVMVGFAPVLTENKCPLSIGSRGFSQSARAGSCADLSCCLTGVCPVSPAIKSANLIHFGFIQAFFQFCPYHTAFFYPLRTQK